MHFKQIYFFLFFLLFGFACLKALPLTDFTSFETLLSCKNLPAFEATSFASNFFIIMFWHIFHLLSGNIVFCHIYMMFLLILYNKRNHIISIRFLLLFLIYIYFISIYTQMVYIGPSLSRKTFFGNLALFTWGLGQFWCVCYLLCVYCAQILFSNLISYLFEKFLKLPNRNISNSRMINCKTTKWISAKS